MLGKGEFAALPVDEELCTSCIMDGKPTCVTCGMDFAPSCANCAMNGSLETVLECSAGLLATSETCCSLECLATSLASSTILS